MNKPETQPGGSLKPVGSAIPMRGDVYAWHTGGLVIVANVDGAMTTVRTPTGSMVQIPTGTLMSKPKVTPNAKRSHGAENH